MKNHKGIFINLHKDNDRKVIDKLDSVSNKQGYIKKLIDSDSSIYKTLKKGEGNG